MVYGVGAPGRAVAGQRAAYWDAAAGQRDHLWTCAMHTLAQVMYVLLMFTGIGSTLFHATLSWAGQMSDEFPMILTALVS